jgi:Asp-tRNA(Asn)/Glu-tRNA(Gln) amidotransferase A subunit family amidase
VPLRSSSPRAKAGSFTCRISGSTQPLSFIGLPVAVAPLAGAGRLPLGVQIIAPAWREDLCLRVAAAMEAGGLACCGEPLKGALAA